jgi:hypothetical protein
VALAVLLPAPAGAGTLRGSATVNGAAEIMSFGGSFTVVGAKADISLGTGTLSLGAPTAASGSCVGVGLTLTGGSYSVMLITPNGLETGATGVEPATSGVTGRSWPLRAERG